MSDSEGKVLLITGASRGIGRATAILAAARGYAVCVNYVDNRDAAAEVVATIRNAGGRARAEAADVGNERDVVDLFDRTVAAFGRLDGLVINAGIAGARVPLVDMTAADMERTLDTNLLGAMLCAREAMRRMALGRGGRGGAIVSLSSQAAVFGGVTITPYAASKAGINALTVGLAREAAAEGVRVNAVSPGIIDTDQYREIDPERRRALDAGLPMGRSGRPEEVAETILWLLSDAASYVSGAVIPVHGAR